MARREAEPHDGGSASPSISSSCRQLKSWTGTTDENSTHLALLKQYARQPDMAALFNYASMSVNNDIFFNALVRVPSRPIEAKTSH